MKMNTFDTSTVEKIRKGYFSALYFNRTKTILQKEKNYKKVTMQIFQKNEGSILCGVDEVKELLKIGTGYWEGNNWINTYEELKIEHLEDGEKLSCWKPVMHITGPYLYFAALESLYLGIFARRTLVATNSYKVVQAAKKKSVLFFADRFDHFLNQEGDGYASHIGGIQTVCTEAQAAWWQGKIAGTIPHALIAINDGNTLMAVDQFVKHIDDKVVALVDFDNDVVKTSLQVASKFQKKLWGVRLDTSEKLTDISLVNMREEQYGVTPTLVKILRKKLDDAGYGYVKIGVSGGFNEEKITLFEDEKTPVDFYGVGSSLLKGSNDFTADIVKVEGKEISKFGRKYMPVK